MAVRPKKPGTSGKSQHPAATMDVATTIIPTEATLPVLLDPAIIAAEDPDHRPSQPLPGPAQDHYTRETKPANEVLYEYSSYQLPQILNIQNGVPSPYLSTTTPHPPPSHDASPSENLYYATHPSPRSAHTAVGPYPSSDKPDSMAATAHMQRPSYPPVYHTPQSNSPASVASPSTHDGRSMYAQPPPQMSQPMYPYHQYQALPGIQQQQAYGTHPSQMQHPHQMAPQHMQPYQTQTSQLQHAQTATHQSAVASSPRLKMEPPQHQHQPQSHQQQPHQTQNRTPMLAQTPLPSAPPMNAGNLQPASTAGGPPNSNAAPGPIPATTPLVVRQDQNGTQWILFEYSRDRVKMEYTIRCDVETVNTDNLSQEFKSENCVYPRACVPKEQYKGNRLAYETDCNAVGWALAELNPCLRSKRGLIQRAVDSWRNSNADQRLRSRRVRRQAKMHTRTKVNTQHASQAPVSAGPMSAGLPSTTSGMSLPSTRGPGTLPSTSQQLHHHHAQGDSTAPGQDHVGGHAYSSTPHQHQQNASSQQITSPNDMRQGHVFGYQNYPSVPTTLGPSMTPTMNAGMHHQLNRQGGNAAMAGKDREERDDEDSALFGDVPEGKRRKFILVDDTQRNCRVRVKVMLDQVEMSEIPDSFRKQNSVYPRSYFPVQMQSTEAESSLGSRFSDEDDGDSGMPTIGRTTVQIHGADGDAEVDVPKLTRNKKGREEKLNELGYRMAWSQGRVFAGRTVFLQRALDAYRNKQRSSLSAPGSEPTTIPAHLETRPGKRRWLERNRGNTHTATPPPTTTS